MLVRTIKTTCVFTQCKRVLVQLKTDVMVKAVDDVALCVGVHGWTTDHKSLG